MDAKSFEMYQINEKKEKALFKNAIIFFDTSALLDFYYYSQNTTNEIFNKLFKALNKKLFISQHTEFEFLKNRNKVLQKPVETYDNLLIKNSFQKDSGHIEEIENVILNTKKQLTKELVGQFKTLKEKTSKKDKHPFIDENLYSEFENRLDLLIKYFDGFHKKYDEFKTEFKSEINVKKEQLKETLKKDQILKQFQKAFITTNSLTHEEILDVVKEGEVRYRNEIPPGYLDFKDKVGFQKYGDLIVWKQLLETAKEKESDVILIINDIKDDWWHSDSKEETKTPRFELIKEFFDNTNKQFWMYTTNEFLAKSKLYIDTKIHEEVIQDVENVKLQWKDYERDIVVRWLMSYFDNIVSVTFNPRIDPNLIIDYTVVKFENQEFHENCFVHRFTNKRNYTGLFIPLREIYESKDELKEKYSIKKLVLIFESNSIEISDKQAEHINRKNPQKIIQNNSEDFQVMIVYKDEDNLEVVYDSEKNINAS